MSRFLKKELAKMEAYVPGEQPRDRAYIKLNTNESPFPPSPRVTEAVNAQAVESLRLYCDPTCKALKAALAKQYGVGEENLFLTNGSDDILNFSFLAYGADGATFADITYGFYSVFAELHGVTANLIPLREDFTQDVERFKGHQGLVVLANPNAPTGIALPLATVEEIVQANPDAVVLVDEAYVDFGGESCVALTKKYANLLCVQTFSKSRSMAGARLGFAIADASLIADLEKIKYSTNPYNINTLTQIAGTAMVSDDAYYRANCKRIMENRDYTVAELTALGFTVLPSAANFVFAKSDRIDGKTLYLALKEKGVLVRHFDKARIADFNRITIGDRAEMETLIARIRDILNER